MKYYEVAFTLSPYSADAADVLAAMIADVGFESFESTADQLIGYVQQATFDRAALDETIRNFPFADTHIIYNAREADDQDWNAQWEQEGFDPIVVRNHDADSQEIIIHDGRHLPTPDESSDKSRQISIEIDAHMAFGTGTHQTTRMMCAALMKHCGQQVLDCGCGTGILAICAAKLGATHCTAYDIDEWSVDNTRHNAIINRVDQQIDVLHGNASLLETMPAQFDLVMANINRNILLCDMPQLRKVMTSEATLIISGFYESDCQMLCDAAMKLGLNCIEKHVDDEWACLVFHTAA